MNKIIDYISGHEIYANPEEVEAVQIYSKILVEDYGYPKYLIQTRPQHRVKIRPSDVKKEYPIDIAVFNHKNKSDDNLQIIVECKKRDSKEGLSQLKDYLRFSKANIGVLYNGEVKAYIHKIEKDGQVLFEEIPNIPLYGQRLEDIGLFKREDLKSTHNLKSIFKTIRNYLAANNVGATRDEVLAQQLINLIFCKIFDEKFTAPSDYTNFRAGIDENEKDVANRILSIFDNVKRIYKDVLDASDKISLDASSIKYVVGELQMFSLMDAERDVISDAFEVFIGHALKGGQGQFFTPRNVVKMMVEILDPNEDDLIIDPACGSGGFLKESLSHIWQNLNHKATMYGWSESLLSQEKIDVAFNCIRGIDKDSFLAKVSKAYMAIIGDGKSGIFCEDSLEKRSNWDSKTRNKIEFESFDIVLTNPPFGSKIPVTGAEKLQQYELAYKWKFDKKLSRFYKDKLNKKEAPQILFIERCLDFLKPGGRMGIVLPDGILGNGTMAHVRDYILSKADIYAIVDIPKETFMPNTSTKTSILFLRKKLSGNENYNGEVFMAICETCGHNRRGIEIEEDDIKEVPRLFKEWKEEKAK